MKSRRNDWIPWITGAALATLFFLKPKKSSATTAPAPTVTLTEDLIKQFADTTIPRGLRNNNPGNIILTIIPWKGKVANEINTDGHFEQFTKLVYGTRALLSLLASYIRGGTDTPRTILAKYAPATENNTAAYIQIVSNTTGFGADQKLTTDKSTLLKLAKAISIVENGRDVLTSDHLESAWSLL